MGTSRTTLRGTPTRRRIIATAVAVAALVATPLSARADGTQGAAVAMARTWGVDNRVLAIVNTGSSVIIGGEFTNVIDPDGNQYPANHVAKFDPATGTFDTSWSLSVDNTVNSMAVDGDTLYLGGSFQYVNGSLHKFLAAVSLSTGALKTGFATQATRSVDAMALGGGFLYVGGSFPSLRDATGFKTVNYLGRVNKTTGAIDVGWSSGVVLDGRVWSLLAHPNGTRLYVGGDFLSINADPLRRGMAAVTTSSPAAIDTGYLSGYTNQVSRAPVLGMDLEGDNLLLAVGGSGGACTLQSATTGTNIWSKHGTGNVVGVAFFGPYSYCGGHFSGPGSFDGQTREKVAAIETATGTLQPWAPTVNSALGVWSMASTANALVIGGDFTKSDATYQPHFGFYPDLTAVTVPTAPTGLTSVSGDTSVVLSWLTPSSDGGSAIQRYRIYRGPDASSMVLVGVTIQASYSDTMVTNGEHYVYAVQARNGVGDSALSTTVDGDPVGGVVTPPSAPLSFNAAGVVGAASLTWVPPTSDGGSPVTGYRIYRSTSTGAEVPYVDVPASPTWYTDANVVVGTRYFYRVTALNAVGESVPSLESSAAPNTGVPGAPTLSLVSSAPHAISLSWTLSNTGASPLTKFVLTRNGIRLAVLGPTVYSYTDTTAVAGTTVVYQVKATNSYGTGKGSNKITLVAP